MDHYERSKLADAVKEHTYQEGHMIIKEGDPEGKHFYIIIEGTAKATKTIDGSV